MSKCIHNKRKSYCKPCGGSAICIHDRNKYTCRDCHGKAFCKHDRLKRTCVECGGNDMCKHAKRKIYCIECGGSAMCEHGKRKTYCLACHGDSICIHQRNKQFCKECKGKQICEHNKRKDYCRMCKGNAICVHDYIKYTCLYCKILQQGGDNNLNLNMYYDYIMNSDLSYYYSCVKQFTSESIGIPNEESILDTERTTFIVKMMLSELVEMLQPTSISNDDVFVHINRLLTQYNTLDHAIIDIQSQKDIFMCVFTHLMQHDIKDCFNEVHKANMRKKWEDGVFHLRPEDNKVIKPPGWVGPNEALSFANVSEDVSVLNTEQIETVVVRACISLCQIHNIDVYKVFSIVDYNKSYDFRSQRTNKQIYIEQVDAIVDIMIYMLDTSARTGFVF